MAGKKVISLPLSESLSFNLEWLSEANESTLEKEIKRLIGARALGEVDSLLSKIELKNGSPDIDFLHFPDLDSPEGRRSARVKIWLKRQFEICHPDEKLVGYLKREALKDEGNAVCWERSKTIQERAEGYLKIVRSHFSRSVSLALSQNDPRSYRIHPGFQVYAAHYLAESALNLSSRIKTLRVEAKTLIEQARATPSKAQEVKLKDEAKQKNRSRRREVQEHGNVVFLQLAYPLPKNQTIRVENSNWTCVPTDDFSGK